MEPLSSRKEHLINCAGACIYCYLFCMGATLVHEINGNSMCHEINSTAQKINRITAVCRRANLFFVRLFRWDRLKKCHYITMCISDDFIWDRSKIKINAGFMWGFQGPKFLLPVCQHYFAYWTPVTRSSIYKLWACGIPQVYYLYRLVVSHKFVILGYTSSLCNLRDAILRKCKAGKLLAV